VDGAGAARDRERAPGLTGGGGEILQEGSGERGPFEGDRAARARSLVAVVDRAADRVDGPAAGDGAAGGEVDRAARAAGGGDVLAAPRGDQAVDGDRRRGVDADDAAPRVARVAVVLPAAASPFERMLDAAEARGEDEPALRTASDVAAAAGLRGRGRAGVGLRRRVARALVVDLRAAADVEPAHGQRRGVAQIRVQLRDR